jgi:hypothetical protein
MQPRPSRPAEQGILPKAWAVALALPLCLATHPAAAAPMEWLPQDWFSAALLAMIALCLLATLCLSALAFRRSLQAPPPALSLAQLEEMRRSVTAFAGLLREGSAMLLQHQRETLDSVERVAAHSQQLIALIAGSEERMTNATARSEILATRVARSAAGEIKSSVESLTAISARIEYQARALEEVTRPVGVRAA